VAEILNCQGDGLVITGDISEGDDVVFELRRLAEAVNQPIFFVLGNHDFYQSSIALTRQRVMEICREHPLLTYLTDAQPICLSDGCYLVGDDGWGDATIGDYDRSPIQLNDFRLIADFHGFPSQTWKTRLQHEGQACAERLEQKLKQLPDDASQVLVITHVPPYRESCWYEGRTTDDLWAPFFVCGAVGDVLQEFAISRPDIQITTLCGHTHHAGIAQVSSNHCVYTGAAEYGVPRVESVVSVCRAKTVLHAISRSA
jgi:3',5'-cyclic-AMP phosphodiesterase